MKKRLALLSLLTIFTTFLFAQPPDSDCTLCQDVCTDLMATASNLQSADCPTFGFQFQLDITGLGADLGDYNILTFDNYGFNTGNNLHNPGGPTSLTLPIFPLVPGCEPEDQTFTFEIQCDAFGSVVLASGIIGTITVYPSQGKFSPDIIPSIACVQDLMITPGPCGTLTLDPDPIPFPGCGGEDLEVDWSVDFGFDYPPECNISPVEGTETFFACDATPGEPCNDNSPCTINDTFDENCSCIGEWPMVTLDPSFPQAACSNEPVDVTVTVNMAPDPPNGLIITIRDLAGISLGLFQLFPGDPLTNTFQIIPFTNNTCIPELVELQIQIQCPFNFEFAPAPIPIGTLAIYPPLDTFIPTIEPSLLCDEEPVISPPACGDLILNVTPANPIGCPAGNNGFIDWTIDPGFDVSAAPDCFDTSAIAGQESITACSTCCPLVAEVTVTDAGPFCTGDMTEVCATFDATFETDAQVTINGVDAVAGEDQICFQLNLVNDGCNYEPLQIPFEIICNEDGSVSNALSPSVLVAPDPANFQYQVDPGTCFGLPIVEPLNGSPCAVLSSFTQITTNPVNSCPPIDGEVEVTLDYYDDNFNILDVAAFGCAEFVATIIEPQPGCSACPCANPPVNVTVTENACEGDMLEVCVEFEVGDEANGSATLIQILGDVSTNAFLSISGDGTSTVYCTAFNSDIFIDCVPVTENLDVTLFCLQTAEPFFNNTFSATVYPSLNKFSYEVTPIVDNCPNAPVYPQIISTGECALDIFDLLIVDPADGCPPTPGSLTYSVNYQDGTQFTNAQAECLFTEVTAAVEPIPACDTCEPQLCSISAEISETICDDNETPQDGSDDMVTIIVTITSTGPWTAGDGTMGNDGDTYSFPAASANDVITMMFSVDGEMNCNTTFSMNVNNCDGANIPTLSQWGLIVLCLLIMSFGAIQISSSVSYTYKLSMKSPNKITPFNRQKS